MRKFTKQLFFASACMLASATFAQTFGIKAGMNMSNMVAEDNEGTYSDDFESNMGFQVGPTMQFEISDVMSFETGLLLGTKGYKITEDVQGYGNFRRDKLNLLYVDVPLTAKATFDLGGAKLYLTSGPYVGVGLSGAKSIEGSDNGDTYDEEEDIKFGSDEDKHDLKRLDYGVTAGVGLEISNIQIGVTYGMGLANISNYTDNGASVNNSVLSFGLAYRFGDFY